MVAGRLDGNRDRPARTDSDPGTRLQRRNEPRGTIKRIALASSLQTHSLKNEEARAGGDQPPRKLWKTKTTAGFAHGPIWHLGA